MTEAQACQRARSLDNWGYDEIQIVWVFKTNERFIRAGNRCGQQRWVNNRADFLELKELEASR